MWQPTISVEMLLAHNSFAIQPPVSAVEGQDRVCSTMPSDNIKVLGDNINVLVDLINCYLQWISLLGKGELLGCDLTSVENYSLYSKPKKYFGELNKMGTHPLSREVFRWILHSSNEINGVKWRCIYACSHSLICKDGTGSENSFICSQRAG